MEQLQQPPRMATAWLQLIKTEGERAKLSSIFRLALIRIFSSVSTTSNPALEVMAGELAIMLKLLECSRIAVGLDKNTAKWCTAVKWQQQETSNQDKATWTRLLMPVIAVWRARAHGAVDRILCQLLSGHRKVGNSTTIFNTEGRGRAPG